MVSPTLPAKPLSLIGLMRAAWQRWQIIARINGDAIARGTVFVFYYTIFAVFAIGARLLADPLKRKQPIGWLARKPVSASIDDARAQS